MLRRGGHIRSLFSHHKPSYEETKRNKEFFLTILAATATKRDAKAYIQRYQRPGQVSTRNGLQTLNDFFSQDDEATTSQSSIAEEPVRIALIAMRDAPQYTEGQLRRLSYTFGQLQRLGLLPVLLLEAMGEPDVGRQAFRLSETLERMQVPARPILDGLFREEKGVLSVANPTVLTAPARRGQVCVIGPTGVSVNGIRRTITSSQAMLALCAGLDNTTITIDKLILLDANGGIPSSARRAGSHVLINLAQETDLLREELTGRLKAEEATRHLQNLSLCQDCLSQLSPSASAAITTPTIAGSGPGEQHPLIHNLLTDKPMFSPSLPKRSDRTPATATTILRLGTPVRVLRDVDLRGPEVDLPRLVALIDDSFGRRLDTEAYLDRLKGSAAALIIAGDYDGAAIVTYEHAGENNKPVAYLDKFAVLRAKQGAGGVADLLFNAMVQAFPDELIWRSRANNPVNKWYFERARGTSSIIGTHWKLFWTQPVKTRARLEGYLEIGRKIQATWLD